jgi:hypothetical protein
MRGPAGHPGARCGRARGPAGIRARKRGIFNPPKRSPIGWTGPSIPLRSPVVRIPSPDPKAQPVFLFEAPPACVGAPEFYRSCTIVEAQTFTRRFSDVAPVARLGMPRATPFSGGSVCQSTRPLASSSPDLTYDIPPRSRCFTEGKTGARRSNNRIQFRSRVIHSLM